VEWKDLSLIWTAFLSKNQIVNSNVYTYFFEILKPVFNIVIDKYCTINLLGSTSHIIILYQREVMNLVVSRNRTKTENML
jgi:hypothetical protein